MRRGGHGQQVTIVAVTKTHGPDAVQSAWEVGIADVGENRVQEALPKMDLVSAPVRWHLIGHLQRNKVKVVPRFQLLHSLDSARLADAVNELGLNPGAPVSALLQVNVVGEESRVESDPQTFGGSQHLSKLEGIRVRGVATMAPLDADESTLSASLQGARAAQAASRRRATRRRYRWGCRTTSK